jgi:hypothetical protein
MQQTQVSLDGLMGAHCPTTMYGGINSLKHHLARVVCKDVVACDGCPEEVTMEMHISLEGIKEQNAKRYRLRFETAGRGRSPMGPPSSCSSIFAPSPSITSPLSLPRTNLGSRPTLDNFNERKRKEADMVVRRFWYHDNL